jgi:hypothetical protein
MSSRLFTGPIGQSALSGGNFARPELQRCRHFKSVAGFLTSGHSQRAAAYGLLAVDGQLRVLVLGAFEYAPAININQVTSAARRPVVRQPGRGGHCIQGAYDMRVNRSIPARVNSSQEQRPRGNL